MIASIFALEKRLELFAAADINPATNDQYQLERIVSYDNGETWVDNWIRNEIGTFSSSAAASITGDSLDTFLVAKGRDNKIWFSRLQEYYEFKNVGWSPIGEGVFTGRPAICSHGNSSSGWKLGSDNKPIVETSYNSVRVMVFAKGNDRKIWWAFSNSGGSSWDMAWAPIGEGQFKTSPAAVCSADGKLVAVFARGQDNKIWWAFSNNGAASWDMAWTAIPSGTFNSAPAAVCSSDGKRLYVFAKGTDNKIWWAFATNGVQKWDMAWAPIGEGVFDSAPSASCSWDGKIIHVFAKGTDNRIWQARSFDFGITWNIAWRKTHSKKFIHIDL